MKKIILLGFLTLISFFSINASAALTGQYGCVLNRNFAGYNTALTGNVGGATNNFLMYLDFDGASFQRQVTLISNYNTVSPAISSTTETGTISQVTGPITNSFTVTGISSNQTVFIIDLLSVNGGNTLMLTESNSLEFPATGVCQKI